MENKRVPMKATTGALKHGPFIFPQTEGGNHDGGGAQSHVFSSYITICTRVRKKMLSEQQYTGHMLVPCQRLKTKTYLKNNIDFTRTLQVYGELFRC